MPGKKPSPKTRPRVLQINPSTKPSIGLLNDVTLFQRRIRFVWIRRRGTIIQAGFANGQNAQWLSATDLRTFSRSQDILFDATGFLIPTPTCRSIKESWEPICQLIRDIAEEDATNLEPALKDEFEQIIRRTWIRARRPFATEPDEFFTILRECQTVGRDVQADIPPRSCVWAGGNGDAAAHYSWVYLDSLLDWLSTHQAKSKYYAWEDARRALLLLDFQPCKLHRSRDGERVHVRVWKGPIEVLVDDDTVSDTQIT